MANSTVKIDSITLLAFNYKKEEYGPIVHHKHCNESTSSDFWTYSCLFNVSKTDIIGHDEIGCRLHIQNSTDSKYTDAKINKDVLLHGNFESLY